MLKDILRYPTVRGSIFYEKASDDGVTCTLCERRCDMRPGQIGYCKTRVNIGGKMFTLVYGDLSAIESRPIEIKPFFHYWPGSTALTFSTWSCNMRCAWCQNHHLSRAHPDPVRARFMSSEKVVGKAIAHGDEGICVSFQEPTLLTDFALEVFELASSKGLYSSYVSNGYMTLEALRRLKVLTPGTSHITRPG